MAPAVSIRNVVFRSIETKWRGPLPCTWSELLAGLVVGIGASAATGVLLGCGLGLALISGLVVWRRLDHDRSDYIATFLRRRLKTVRAYNCNEPDDTFVPFQPRS